MYIAFFQFCTYWNLKLKEKRNVYRFVNWSSERILIKRTTFASYKILFILKLETMKKFTFFTLMMLFSAMTISLTSCSKGSSDDTPKVSFSSLAVKYTVTVGGDFLKIFDVTIQYKDASGKVQSETMTTDTYTKSLTVKSLPYTSGIKATVKLKDNLDTTAKYSISYLVSPEYNAYTSDGQYQTLARASTNINQNNGVAYANLPKLVDYVNKMMNTAASFTLSGSSVIYTATAVDF